MVGEYIPNYDKKYFEDLDKLVEIEMKKKPEDRMIEFIPMTSDFMFKSVMKQNPDIFKDFLINTMNIDIDEDDNYLIFLDSELIKNNKKEKGKRVDLRVSIGKGLLITVEVNRMRYSEVKVRNDLFFEKMDIMQFEVGEEYKVFKYKKLYQLNLNASPDERKDINKRMIVDYDILNKEIVDDRKIKFVINLANYYDMYYNESKEMSLNEIFLAGLMSKSFTEMYTIMSKILSPKDLDEFMESVVNMCKEFENIHEWQKEKMDAMVEYNIRENARTEGYAEGHAKGHADGHAEGRAEGREEGIKEGIEQGIKQNTLTTIKNMLTKKYSYEDISDITGKSVAEIKKIGQSINE